jgi:hypothetical protein
MPRQARAAPEMRFGVLEAAAITAPRCRLACEARIMRPGSVRRGGRPRCAQRIAAMESTEADHEPAT